MLSVNRWHGQVHRRGIGSFKVECSFPPSTPAQQPAAGLREALVHGRRRVIGRLPGTTPFGMRGLGTVPPHKQQLQALFEGGV